MAELQVTVKVVKDDLKKLRTELEQLKKDAKEIKIEIKGEDSLKKLTDALNKYSQSTVDASKALTDAKRAEIDLVKAQTSRINAASALQRKQQEGININRKTTLEIQKQNTAYAKATVEQEKTAQSANRLATEQIKTERALTKTTTAASKLGETWKRMFSAFSMSNIVSSGVTRAISQMRSYFNEALNEMKELDTALTHYRQVTGASAGEASTLGSQAYSVGSKYGTSAADYAESVATYARAGYKETADELAELSLKTVIVGQTTQEIADQFLLTMDAAYGYKGSVEELSKVLDGASAIDSTYATTIEKIAAGLGLVAPLAQQVHVSEKELTAAIGTITAVTQRSGAESARALRSLFLNILKDTTTEIEEGVTATQESIADMDTLLNKYARSAVEAAKASGQVINPMEAIGALAQSMKEGFLTEKELMDMMSSLGGKLRVSQLVALVSNWDTYVKMMGTYEDSIGSADEKTRVYLDSWEAKVNILKNTWTEFIANTLDTDMFKGMLDGAAKVLKVIGNLKNAIVLLGGAITGIKIATVAHNFSKVAKAATEVGESLRKTAIETMRAGKQEEALAIASKARAQEQIAANKAVSASILNWVAIAVTAVTTVYSLYQMHHQQYMQQLAEEREKAIDAARVQQDKAQEVYDAYETYWNAKSLLDENKISTEQYETAVYNLATALGVQETALRNNINALETLSKTEIRKAIKDTEDALQVAKNTAYAELKEFELPEWFSRKTFMDAYASGWQKEGYYQHYSLLSDLESAEDVDTAVGIYKQLVELQDKYLQNSKGNGSEVENYTRSYNQLSGALKDYADWLQPIIDLEEKKAGLDEQLANIQTGNLDVKEAELVASALGGEADAAEEAAKSFKGLASAIKDAQDALEIYQKQTKTEKDTTYSAYADAWKAAYEDIKLGMKNSNAVNAALDLFFTPEQIMKMHDKGVEAADVIASDFWKDIFTYVDSKGETQFINDDAGSNFIWALKDKYADAAGEIRNENGELVASFQEVDGELSVQVGDFEALSKALSALPDGIDVDPDVLAAIFEALGMYSTELQETPEGIKAIAEGINAVNEAGEIDLAKLIQGKIDENATTEEIMDLYEAILKMHDEEGNPVKVEVKEGESLDDVKKKVEDLIKNRDTLDKKDPEITVKTDTTQAEKDMQRIILKEQEIEDRSPTVTIDVANDKANQKIAETIRLLQLAESHKQWAEANAKPQGGSNNMKMDTQASGTGNAPGGLTLVNERGAEIIDEDGGARIAGNGRPTLTWVESGATIYNASQTRAILGGVDATELYDGINAYAGGSANGIKRFTPKDKAASSSSSSSGSSSTSTSKSKSSSKSSTTDAQLEKLKEAVELRKSELSLLEAQDASIKKQIQKQREISKALDNQIKYMEKQKYPQKDINALKTEQLKIEKEIANLNKQLYDNLQKSVNKEIDNLNKKRDQEKQKIQDQIDALQKENEEKQKSVELEEKTLAVQEAKEKLRNAQNQRTVRYYNATSGQWEWAANANEVKSAQEALDEAKKSLSEYKADQKLDRQIAKLEKQQEKVDTKYDKQIDLLQQIIDSFEEPVGSIKKAVKQIEKNATKDQKTTINTLNKLLVKALGNGYKISTKGLYDSGGILQGIGGIKGTTADEVVLPPDITSSMLKPISTATLNNRLNELRYLYGATGGIAGITNSNTIGSQHIGDLYNLGGVTLTEGQARSTTVYDLIQMSRGLRAYNAM